MNTITTLHQLGLIALGILAFLGVYSLLFLVDGNSKAEAQIKRLMNEIEEAETTLEAAIRIGDKIEKIDTPTMDNNTFILYKKMRRSFNQKFAKVHTI